MPRASNGLARNHAFAQGSAVVCALGAEGKDRFTDAGEKNGLIPDMAADHALVRQISRRDTFNEVRTVRFLAFVRHGVSLKMDRIRVNLSLLDALPRPKVPDGNFFPLAPSNVW
jgi:hypothetical protein